VDIVARVSIRKTQETDATTENVGIKAVDDHHSVSQHSTAFVRPEVRGSQHLSRF
jgi:hypothetical protein